MDIANHKFYPALKWLRKNLFNSVLNSFVTVVLLVVIVKVFSSIVDWAFINSSWNTTAAECRGKNGACWPFLQEKARFILLGYYPEAEQWRPIFLILTFFGLFFVSIFKYFWRKRLIFAWILFTLLSLIIMRGGFWGCPMLPWTNGRDWP